jgi:hypothetical protein
MFPSNVGLSTKLKFTSVNTIRKLTAVLEVLDQKQDAIQQKIKSVKYQPPSKYFQSSI